MRIVKGFEPMTVDHPVMLIFGQPGICKTSLGYSMADPLLLDFDLGAHRAVNRRDTIQITQWGEAAEVTDSAQALTGYRSVVADTCGRCLDVLAADIIKQNPKLARDGALTQQGWGTLKMRFRQWVASLRLLGKDVLLLAHDKEDRDGESRIVRPDIVGGSFGEVFRIADFVGYLYMHGKERVLDFSPTDRWLGKNPGQWAPFVVPPAAKAQTFLAERFEEGRAVLGQISAESAKVTETVNDWRSAIEALTTPDELNQCIPQIQAMPKMAGTPVGQLLKDRAKALGLVWNSGSKSFTVPQAKTA